MEKRDGRGQREESLVELVARANHVLSEGFQEQLKELGLSPTEWRILAALGHTDGVMMTTLAETVLFKQPTLTKAIDRMARAQLVERRGTATGDRRVVLVFLTERGRRVAVPLLRRARRHETAARHAVGGATERAVRTGLARLIDAMAEVTHAEPPRIQDRQAPDRS